MKRFLGSVCYALGAVIVVLGVLTVVQMRAPWWQKVVALAVTVVIGAGLAGLGRLARRPAAA